MVYSSPSIFTSVPVYLPVMTRSPALSCITTSLPSTMPPGPTAITREICGFSCAALVSTMPLFVVSSAFSA